jgi:hypothetical protein
LDKQATLKKKENEPEQEMKKIQSKDFSKELQKVKDNAGKFKKYIDKVANPYAKDFLLTFYSGNMDGEYDP